MTRYRPGSSADVLGDPDLGRGPAEQQARVLARCGDLADPELAVALVLPAAPLGEDQSELVLVLGDLEGGVFEEIPVLAPEPRPEVITAGLSRATPDRSNFASCTSR